MKTTTIGIIKQINHISKLEINIDLQNRKYTNNKNKKQ